MVIRTLVSGLMLILLLGAQASLPGQANASNCCPCSAPCGGNCFCRANGTHCPLCRSRGSDLFEQYAVAITPSSDFSPTQEVLSALPSLPLVDQSGELLALTRKRNRTIGDFTSRLMAGAEFRIKSWCPGSLDKSV
jgi:hypothetical protein